MRSSRTVLGLVGALAMIIAMLGFAPSASAAGPDPQVAPEPQATPVATTTQNAATLKSRARCRIPYCYGAIAINLRTGGSSYAYNYTTKKKALRHARKSCARNNGRGCKAVIWRRNGCAAVAWRGQHGRLVEWAARHAFSKKKAIRKAKRAVRGKGKERVWTWVCTSRR